MEKVIKDLIITNDLILIFTEKLIEDWVFTTEVNILSIFYYICNVSIGAFLLKTLWNWFKKHQNSFIQYQTKFYFLTKLAESRLMNLFTIKLRLIIFIRDTFSFSNTS